MADADPSAVASPKSVRQKSNLWIGLGMTALLLVIGHFAISDLFESDESALYQLVAAPLAIGAFLFFGIMLAAGGASAYAPRAAPFFDALGGLAGIAGLLCFFTVFAVVLTLEALVPSGKGEFSMGGLELLLPAVVTRFLERGLVALLALLFGALAALAWIVTIAYFLRRWSSAAAIVLLIALPAFIVSQTAYYARIEQRAQREWLAWRYDARTPLATLLDLAERGNALERERGIELLSSGPVSPRARAIDAAPRLRLEGLLASDDAAVRKFAIQALLPVHDPEPDAIPALVAATAHPVADVRLAALTALRKLPGRDSRAAAAASAALDDASPEVRHAACRLLATAAPDGPAALTCVTKYLRDADARRRGEAIGDLGRLAIEPAHKLALLAERIEHDPDREVLRRALNAFNSVEGPSELKLPLARAQLASADSTRRYHGASILWSLGAAAAPALEDIRLALASRPGGWEDSPLLHALIAIRTPEALDAVRAYMRAHPRSGATHNAKKDLRRAGIAE